MRISIELHISNKGGIDKICSNKFATLVFEFVPSHMWNVYMYFFRS